MGTGGRLAHGLLWLGLLLALVPAPLARQLRDYHKDLRGYQAEEEPSGPKVKLSPRKFDATLGQEVSLRCRVSGNPAPSITWLKDGQEILSDTEGYAIRQYKKGSKLHIYEASEGDVGLYQCKANNMYGEKIQDAMLVIAGPTVNQEMCLEQTFCLNGGTCYYFQTLGTKFCKCTADYVGSRCQYKDPVEIVKQVSDRDALQFDRTMTITGIILAVLVLAAICITAYCLAKQRREEFYKRKSERERWKAQANGSAYQPVNQLEVSMQKLPNPHSNPSPNTARCDAKPSKSTVTQTEPDWLIGRETETSLTIPPTSDYRNDTRRDHRGSRPAREKRHPPSPVEGVQVGRRERVPSGDKPHRSSLNTSVVNAVVESDHDPHRDHRDSSAAPPRNESNLNHRPRNRLRHEDSDGSRGSKGSRDSKGNVSLELDARSEYDNQASDMEVNHESEVDMQALEQSGDEVKGLHSTETESDTDTSSSGLGEEAALFEQLKKKNPQILEGLNDGSPRRGNDNEPPFPTPFFAPFHPPNNYALKPYANNVEAHNNLDNKKSSSKRNHKHRKEPNLQERIMKELQDDTDATPV